MANFGAHHVLLMQRGRDGELGLHTFSTASL